MDDNDIVFFLRPKDIREYINDYVIVYENKLLWSKRIIKIEDDIIYFDDGSTGPIESDNIFNPLLVRELANDAFEVNASSLDSEW